MADIPVKDAGEGAQQATNPFSSSIGGLPVITQEQYDAIPTPDGPAGATNADELISFAKKFVGTPYKWGGDSPLGFDCSGFVQYVFKNAAGVDLPRISYQQANYGPRVSVDQAKPGDLIAWDTSSRNDGADHIAIYLGNGYVIQAPKPGDQVKISKIWGNPWAVSMNL